MKYVIIGNGIAGIQAAEAIRQLDPKGALTMIGDETFPPYCRPMISRVLEGASRPADLPIRSDRFYEELNITPVLGQRAAGLDVENRRVLMNPDGKTLPNSIPFDKLLIASGADPRPIKAEGLHLKNIFFMRTQRDVSGMLKALEGVDHALVLGGGLVGFKAVYGLLHRGVKVTLLIKSGYPLSMQADEAAGQMILEGLAQKGLDVRVGIEAVAFEGRDRVDTAHLSDGSILPCDMVIIGKGVLPALDFIPRDRISVDLGILVDEHLETSIPGIYAAGDAAEFIDIARQTRWVNALWPEAVNQGRIAGFNMAGRPVAYPGSLSRNVIRIFDMDVMTGGLVNPAPNDPEFEVIAHRDTRRNTYRKLVFRENRLAGMVLVNDIEQGGLLLSAIYSRKPLTIPHEFLMAPGLNYKQLMA
ncbi:MAG: NAD(P)/FAD-dependent oxidoreductase [Thermodesulfobacteriota bacterium]